MPDSHDALDRIAALLSPEGQELLAYLKEQTVTAETALRLGTELRSRYAPDLVALAVAQHELRLRARGKFSRAMDMFFTRTGLEQASAEVVARHRAGRYRGAARLADLCCGIGGDLIALAARHRVIAVDLDPLQLRIAMLNAGVYGVGANVSAVNADVRDVRPARVDAVFIDPARRTAQRRLRAGASEPPLSWCLRLTEQVPRVGIKAAPGIAHTAVPPGWELEFVAVGRELKEAVAWSPALATAATRATVLPGNHVLTPGSAGPLEVRPPGEFLLDPNPAVTRAGAVAELAHREQAWQIDPKIAFLSTDRAVRTPFARCLRVLDSAPWNQRLLRARLRALDIGSVDIRRRGLAGDVGLLRSQLRLSGSLRATLVMTRVRDRPWGLICVDVDEPGDLKDH